MTHCQRGSAKWAGALQAGRERTVGKNLIYRSQLNYPQANYKKKKKKMPCKGLRKPISLPPSCCDNTGGFSLTDWLLVTAKNMVNNTAER